MGLPEYLSGGRIQGRTDDTVPASGVQATSWKLLYDSGDVTSSTAEYLSDTFAARDHLMIINAGDSGTSGGTSGQNKWIFKIPHSKFADKIRSARST